MYKIGDNVVYGANGVMTVVDLRDETVGDTVRTYYVLGNLSGHRDSLIFVPLDNDKLIASMRPLMTREGIDALIKDVVNIPECDWVPDSRRRADYFKSIIDSADQRAIIGLIKTVYKTGERRIAEGKKNYLADEGALHKAEHILYSELSVVLGIDYSAVAEYIKNNM